MTTTDHPTLTTTQLDALPVGSAVRCTTERGRRVVLALKVGGPQSSGGHIWRTTEGATHPASFAIAQRDAVLLEPAEPGPAAPDVQVASATLTTPDEVDVLPLRAVLRTRGGSVVENAGGPLPWLGTGFTGGLESTDLDYPVTVLWPTPTPADPDRALAAHHVEAARHRFVSDRQVSNYNPELQAVRRGVLRVLDSAIRTIRDGSEATR